MELVHHDIVIELRRRLFVKRLRIEGLNGNKQMFDALRAIVTNIHLSEVGVLQNSPKGVHALLEDFLSVRDEQQTAGLIWILLAKAFVVQSGDHRFAGSSGCHNKVPRVSTDSTLSLQLVQDFLLIGIRQDVHGVDFSIVGVKILLCLKRTGQALPLPLIVVFKLFVIPVEFKGRSDLVDGLRQVLPSDLCVPFQAAGQRSIGKIG